MEAKTLRDEIAIAALVAIIGRGDLDTDMNVMPYCKDAYTIADAMLEARICVDHSVDTWCKSGVANTGHRT